MREDDRTPEVNKTAKAKGASGTQKIQGLSLEGRLFSGQAACEFWERLQG